MTLGIAINGEGRGHFTRARALAEILRERHRIVFWVPEHLKRELAAYFPDATIYAIPYLKFIQNGFSIDYVRTISENALNFLFPFHICDKIRKQLQTERVEAVLSDFEPFSSRSARAAGIPVLQLNHPGVVTRVNIFTPDAVASQFVSRYMMSCADRTIICSFFRGDVGPIIRSELRAQRVSRGDYFVVYMKPMYRDCLEPALEAAGRGRFMVFPDYKLDYAKALAGCAGLIAPAGHQSISEALALGKPVLAIPVEGQFEQELNARELRESGFGDYARASEIGVALPRFINELDRFENAMAACRISGGTSPSKRWKCGDETERAAALVENFMNDAHALNETRKKAGAFQALYRLG